MRKWFMSLGWSQRIGFVFGATYVIVGLVGFAVTSDVGFVSTSGKDLVLFEVNPLHNIIHLAIGAALIFAARASVASSRLMNRLIGGTYLLVAVAGTILVEMDSSLFSGLIKMRSDLNILALNHPDNLLHIASAIVLIGSTFIGRRRTNDSIASKVEDSTGEMQASDAEADDEPEAAAPVRAVTSAKTDGFLTAGDIVPRSGTYRCACGNFAVAIRANRDFPDCPEPTGTDEDHYFRLQRSPSTSKGKSKSKSPAKRSSSAKRGSPTSRR